jgi:hypothetical protein
MAVTNFTDIVQPSEITKALNTIVNQVNSGVAGVTLATLGAAASGANSDITQLIGLASTLTATSGTARSNLDVTTVSPSASSTALYEGIDIQVTYPAAANPITGAGHIVPIVGEIFNNNTSQTLPLCVGSEVTLDTLAGTITTLAIGVESKVRSNAGTITTSYNYEGTTINSGTITIAAGVTLGLVNTGTIASYVGHWVPNIASGTITSSFNGFRFENQTTAIAGAKHCLLCLDAGADINTIGPIVTTNKTTTNTFALDTGTKTATATAGAATLNKSSGKITTEALTTAGLTTYTLTLTNSQIAAADTVFVSLANGTNSTGIPTVGLVTPGVGSVVIIINNAAAVTAFNGTLVISFACMKA